MNCSRNVSRNREEFARDYGLAGSVCLVSSLEELEEPLQRRSCWIQRTTYEGQFSIAMFLDLAEQRNTIASRSTKVTFARSSATVWPSTPSPARVRSSSGTYSLVNCPQRHTLSDLGSTRTGVIFITAQDLLSDQPCKYRTKTETLSAERMLINLECLDSRFQCRSRNPQARCRTVRTGNTATRF